MKYAAKPIPESADQKSAIIGVERAIGDLRLGLPVVVASEQSVALYGNPETLGDEGIRAWFVSNQSQGSLVITASRARRIGMKTESSKPVRLALRDIKNSEEIIALVQRMQTAASPERYDPKEANVIDEAAVRLAKLAFLLPCMLAQSLTVKPADAARWAFDNGYVFVRADAVHAYSDDIASSVEIVSEARVPLSSAKDTRVVAFRPRIGNAEHLAIVVGDITGEKSPLVRVHSSCVTGDILGSLRCDCGEQLHAAIEVMEKKGAGVLLYLNQEGRGIGIANKLRAYALQDSGLDTVDANIEMGYEADERTYQVAVRMLMKLGVKSVRLMTNNPDKVNELSRYGIVVAERVPLAIAPGEHNSAYLDTKAKRCGHIL